VIARLGREQAETLGQINRSVHEIDQNTQSNAAMAEQATAARGLADQTKSLNKLIERFRIAGQAAPQAAALPASVEPFPKSPAPAPQPPRPPCARLRRRSGGLERVLRYSTPLQLVDLPEG
jgi:methyl-accepting chemotaxis protein